MSKRKILIISTVGLIYDGITSVIMAYLEFMSLSNLDIQLVGTINIEPKIRQKIESLGCEIIDLPNRRTETIKYFFELARYIRKENIDVVHAHGNSATLAVDLLAAKLGGAKKRIAHSHNTQCNQIIADKIMRPMFNALYTDAVACSFDAGKWLFGNKPFTILANGRDIEKYKFVLAKRQALRLQYGITNELVIGHVGGFYKQKNHEFLIDVFRKVVLINPNTKLILIGDGPLKNTIENSVQDISDKVLFLGTTDHVEDYLNIMDVMALPSLFEGLPLVVIEWQINGLPCVISDTVTKDCAVSDLVKFESLNKGSSVWAKELVGCSGRRNDMTLIIEDIKKAGFDIKNNASVLKKLYDGTCE